MGDWEIWLTRPSTTVLNVWDCASEKPTLVGAVALVEFKMFRVPMVELSDPDVIEGVAVERKCAA